LLPGIFYSVFSLQSGYKYRQCKEDLSEKRKCEFINKAPKVKNELRVIIKQPEAEGGRLFELSDPVAVVETTLADEVMKKLDEVDQAVGSGLFAAGFLTYEAAAGLDSAFCVHENDDLPMVWFGIFKRMERYSKDGEESFSIGTWQPTISQTEYTEAFKKIRKYIESGDTYQVNYTFRLRSKFAGDPFSYFNKLVRAQPEAMGIFIDNGDIAICSASPEVFFRLDDDVLISMPMKGTAARGLSMAEDRYQKSWLERSPKNRAENTMIVDLIRNDMGRIAKTGSVKVSNLFHVERYPTVFQMTTTVHSQTQASFAEIMRALFPCASITGAPKVRTMQIIHELEPERRGIYTGCVGYLAPGRQAKFNVAIRTVMIDRKKSVAEYGVGGGIIWDSEPEDEYRECQTKALLLTAEPPEFDLLESLLWDGKNGYFLLDRHLNRLADSAEYFKYKLDLSEVRNRLLTFGWQLQASKHKVRLCVDRNGTIRIESSPLVDQPAGKFWRLGLAKTAIDSKNPFLYHKTTWRTVYNSAMTDWPRADDVLLWNERDELTETRIGNIVVELDGKRYTPPVSSGLLAGVFREELLASGAIHERVINRKELYNIEKLFVINSVRKWLPAEVMK
jgi:para-aminobenzoate synthetase/4-amino-4-deoxychorismate lyase